MATLPVVFSFDRAQVTRFESPKSWLAALSSTGRFYRSPEGKIWFLVSRNPLEVIALGRRDELRAIVADGDILRVEAPHALSDDDYAGFWFWLSDYRYKLPSAAASGIVPGPDKKATRR